MIELLVMIAVIAVQSAPTASLITRRRPDWTVRKTALISSAPLPFVGLGLCVWLFADAAMSSREECGVDACGMAMLITAYAIVFMIVTALLRKRFWQ
jgi:hypothetical protein